MNLTLSILHRQGRPHARARYHQPTGGPDLFGLAVYGDFGDPDRSMLPTSSRPVCALPDEAYYREDHYAPVREAYVNMVATQLVNAMLQQLKTTPTWMTNRQSRRTRMKAMSRPPQLPVRPPLMARHFLPWKLRLPPTRTMATRDSVKTYNPPITTTGRHTEELSISILD